MISCDSNMKTSNDKCRFCHKYISRQRRLHKHESNCKLSEDKVRMLEMFLCKNVELYPESRRCRFCDKTFFDIKNLHRHDKTCKNKEQYNATLLKECRMKENVMNTDWNDLKGMYKLMDYIMTPEQIQDMTKTGDVAVSLSNIARTYYSYTCSVICTNVRSNTVQCKENGTFVCHNVEYVSLHNIEPMIHKVQDTKVIGYNILNIDEYNRLDQITRIPSLELTKEQKVLLKRVMDEQKNAAYDAFKNRCL